MLVLSRKKDERIIIGDNIVIEVLSIRDDIIRLGVTAPPEVVILRHELKERLDRERQDREREGGAA
jgi:carbon storage regulator